MKLFHLDSGENDENARCVFVAKSDVGLVFSFLSHNKKSDLCKTEMPVGPRNLER